MMHIIVGDNIWEKLRLNQQYNIMEYRNIGFNFSIKNTELYDCNVLFIYTYNNSDR